MDEQAANLVFSLVEAELLDTLRSRKGTGLRSDLKAIVDKTSSVLGDIDTTKYPRLSMNIDSIDDYLDGPSMPSFTQLEHAFCVNNGITVPTTCLSVTKGVSKDPSVLSAHLTLPFVRAVTQHDLLLSRMRSGLSRAVEEYDNIIEDYKLNVALNPDSSEAWHHLGQAHSDLADELLLVPASEILSNRYDIAILQRSAVSCAVQAKQLLPSLVTSNLTSADSHGTSNDGDGDGDDGNGDDSLQKRIQKLHIRIYSFTACLLYRIALFALLSTLTKHLYSSSLDVDMVTRRIAVFETIYSLANQGKPDLAKQTLQTVLQTRSSNKLLSSFYKPDFEAPGKHYLYLEKYLGLYIETLVATSDIEGVQIILRKLKRCSGMFFDSSEMQLRIKSAETSTLNKMVHDLNCPRFVIDNLGKEHIVLQKALDEGSVVEEYSVTRHCRLNRTQFNCARDFARDNIAFCISFREHIDNIITTAEKENIESRKAVADDAATPETKDQVDTPLAVIKRTRQVLNQYLDTATRAMALFNVLLDKKKKHFDDAGTLSKLNDNLADLYILILSTYGQERLSILLHPHQSDDTAELASMCSRVMALVSSHLSPKDTGGLFWQHVLFDEANNESSQQYKLLDPLLEFNVNKLLDSVRDARALQPNPFVLNKPRSDVAQVLAQATTQPTTATSVEGELYSPQQPPAN
ncbi:Histone transcription regulator 3 [Coemansia sp. RSA 1813]|nr:Histone transcription regulator 3 [Coemansia sp. RSA 1813]